MIYITFITTGTYNIMATRRDNYYVVVLVVYPRTETISFNKRLQTLLAYDTRIIKYKYVRRLLKYV